MSGTNGIGVCFSFWDAEQIPSNVSVMEMVTPYYVLCRKKRLSNFPDGFRRGNLRPKLYWCDSLPRCLYLQSVQVFNFS